MLRFVAKRTKQTLKLLHELGSAGIVGAAATQLVLSHRSEGLGPAEYAAMRDGILQVTNWLLMPSLVIMLMSGLFAMVVHSPFQRAGWALTKAATTLLILEGTLVGVQGPAQAAARLANEIAAGEPSHTRALAEVLRHERGALWVILVVCAVNIALAVYRPRFSRTKSEPVLDEQGGEPDDEQD